MKQISVVASSGAGLTARIAEALGARGINIETLDIESAGEARIVTMTVDQYDEALQALWNEGLEAVTEDALLLRLQDEPGGLARVARRFRDADIHVRSLRIVTRRGKWAIVAVSVDRTEEACELVKDLLITEEGAAGSRVSSE